jgi:hypothetical protein
MNKCLMLALSTLLLPASNTVHDWHRPQNMKVHAHEESKRDLLHGRKHKQHSRAASFCALEA